MRNKIFSLLMVLCLATCQLPIKAAAAVSAAVALAGNTLEVKKHDTPAYFVNTDAAQPDTDAEENWNAKLIWNKSEDIPTLYLRGFAVDDSEQTGIFIPAGQPMRIVISENSQVKAKFGILYQSNLEIISEGDAKLTIEGLSGAVTSNAAAGCSLTLDANLDLFVKTYYDASSHILQTNKADLTVNGGSIKIRTDDEKSLFGIVTRGAGNIIINDGKLDVTSSIGAAPANGSIHASGKLIINGGTVKATAKTSTPLYAKKGIEITAGSVEVSSPYYGISAGTPDEPAHIVIQGGTVKIAAKRAFFTYPTLGEGVFAYAGADENSAKIYDGTLTALAKEPWMLISNDPALQKETEPTQAPAVTTPTALSTSAPTTAPTVVATAASATIPTITPTEAPTEASTEAPAQTPNEKIAAILTAPQLLLWLAAVASMGIIGIIITLIVFRRKK